MSCKDCQCNKNLNHTLTNLDITDRNQSVCRCSSRDVTNLPEGSGCSCCRPPPPNRNCRCCPCRSCCNCCSCCSTRPGVCSGRKDGQICHDRKEEAKPKPAGEVVDNCKCCAAKEEEKPKKVCAGCGCDKCP